MLQTLKLRSVLIALFILFAPAMVFAGSATHASDEGEPPRDETAATDPAPATASVAAAAPQAGEALTVADAAAGIEFLELAPQLASGSGYCQARACQTHADCDALCPETFGICTWVPVLCPNNPICLCYG